jgi:hypothetical protein
LVKEPNVNIYLRHEKYGTKVAISRAEAAEDIQWGWEEFDPTEPQESVEVDDEPVNNLQVKKRRKESA